MYDITLKRLKNSGWFLERKISTRKLKELYRQRGFLWNEIAQRFLENYGMLEFQFTKTGSPFQTTEKINFNPISALGKTIHNDFFNQIGEEFSDVVEIIDKEFYPIGEIARGNLIIFMTNDGKFFSYTNGCLIKNGENTEEMLDCVIGEIHLPHIYE